MKAANISNVSWCKHYDFEGHLIPFAEQLFINLRNHPNRYNKELVAVFADLESEDAVIVKKAEDTLEYCVQNGLRVEGLNLRCLALRSLPVLLDNAAQMEQLILKQSESNHATIRQRALFACSYLIKSGYTEGFTTAASVASKKLRGPLQYFEELLTQSQPTLSHEDLLAALKVASALLVSEELDFFAQGYAFLEELAEKGQKDDVLEIKDAIFATYYVEDWKAFNLCHTIAKRFSDSQKLLSIPLEVANAACASEHSYIRKSAVSLLRSIFLLAPEYGIEAFIQGILMESKQPDPFKSILSKLKCLVTHDFSDFPNAKEIVEKRWKEDSVILLEALTCLSCCRSADIRKQAAELKQTLENRLENSESEK